MSRILTEICEHCRRQLLRDWTHRPGQCSPATTLYCTRRPGT